MCKFHRSAPSCWLVLTLVFLLPAEEVVGNATDTGSAAPRGLWESDIFFIQKLASFFGGGKDEGKTSKPKEPIRRNDQDVIFRHETVPPQLFHPERIDGPNGPLTIVSHASRPSTLPHRAAQGPSGVRVRPPGFPQRQKMKLMKVPHPLIKHGENALPFRGHPQSNRPFRIRPGGTPFAKPDHFRMPPPIGNSINNLHNSVNINMRHHLTPPPPSPIISSQKPLINPVSPAFTSPPVHVFTSSFNGNSDLNNKLPFSNHAPQAIATSSFSLPGDSSVVIPQPVTFKNEKLNHPNSLHSRGSLREVTRVKQPQFLSGLSFNSIGLPSKEKRNQSVNLHQRPSPQPQKVKFSSSKDISSKTDGFDNPFEFDGSENKYKYEGLQKKFEYNGSDDFQPSPKEGNMLDDAFQPIFRASQKLDVDLPASFMKPIHVASARALTFTQPPPPPEVIDFLDEDGRKSI